MPAANAVAPFSAVQVLLFSQSFIRQHVPSYVSETSAPAFHDVVADVEGLVVPYL